MVKRNGIMRKNYVKDTIQNLERFWVREQSFTVLLLVLSVYIFVVIPLVRLDFVGQIVFLVFYFLFMSSGLPYLSRNNKAPFLLFLLFLAPFAMLIAEILVESNWVGIASDLFIVFYCALLGRIILLRTFEKGPVNTRRVQGAIVVYLLISFIFAMLYHAIYLFAPAHAFRGLTSFGRKEFMYFSLTTLTTVGYGDISPSISPAKSMSNLESLIGQLYPAILIARLVSMEFISSKEE
jgi:Ion channel